MTGFAGATGDVSVGPASPAPPAGRHPLCPEGQPMCTGRPLLAVGG